MSKFEEIEKEVLIDKRLADCSEEAMKFFGQDYAYDLWEKVKHGDTSDSRLTDNIIFYIQHTREVPNTISPSIEATCRDSGSVEFMEGSEFHRFNADWFLDSKGNMCHNRGYDIAANRLSESDWLSHLMEKVWFDANTFLPAYFEACRRAGIEKLTINIE